MRVIYDEFKKSGNPTQPGHRSNTSPRARRRKKKSIIHRSAAIFKRMNWKGRALLLILTAVLLASLFALINQDSDVVTAQPPASVENADELPGFVMIEQLYPLTDAERREIASVVTAEAVGEPYAGKVAVAQCILQACYDDGLRPIEAIKKYKYCKLRPEPCDEALEAVRAVFDLGEKATAEPIKYFYAPARVRSSWHESQDYVMTINNHRFFKEAAK